MLMSITFIVLPLIYPIHIAGFASPRFYLDDLCVYWIRSRKLHDLLHKGLVSKACFTMIYGILWEINAHSNAKNLNFAKMMLVKGNRTASVTVNSWGTRLYTGYLQGTHKL